MRSTNLLTYLLTVEGKIMRIVIVLILIVIIFIIDNNNNLYNTIILRTD